MPKINREQIIVRLDKAFNEYTLKDLDITNFSQFKQKIVQKQGDVFDKIRALGDEFDLEIVFSQKELKEIMDGLSTNDQSELALRKELADNAAKHKKYVVLNLCQDMDNFHFKYAIKSLFLENPKDKRTESLLCLSSLASIIPMMLFLDALHDRDFITLKALLPYLFMAKSKLLSDYHVALNRHRLTQRERVRNASTYIEQCQKDMVNVEKYTKEDVWLMVILALLKPMAKILPMSKLFDFSGDVNFDYKCGEDEKNFDTLKNEIVFVKTLLPTLMNLYKMNPDKALEALQETQPSYVKDKESMECQNFVYNILNVFAWLPLLLTNIKRLYNGESMRLFHYVGSKYSENLSKDVITSMTPKA